METKQEKHRRLGAALEKFIEQVRNNIEEEIPNWLNENPYWEIDGDDGLPERCPRTTAADAREDLCDRFIREGEDLGYFDFFEFVISEAFNVAMSKDNKFREKTINRNPSLNPFEQQILHTNQLCSKLINDTFGGTHE